MFRARKNGQLRSQVKRENDLGREERRRRFSNNLSVGAVKGRVREANAEGTRLTRYENTGLRTERSVTRGSCRCPPGIPKRN